MLVLTVPKDLHKLLQNGHLASVAALCELCRVVVVAINVAVMLIIAVLRSKYCVAQRAGKVVDMVFSVEGGDVRAS